MRKILFSLFLISNLIYAAGKIIDINPTPTPAPAPTDPSGDNNDDKENDNSNPSGNLGATRHTSTSIALTGTGDKRVNKSMVVDKMQDEGGIEELQNYFALKLEWFDYEGDLTEEGKKNVYVGNDNGTMMYISPTHITDELKEKGYAIPNSTNDEREESTSSSDSSNTIEKTDIEKEKTNPSETSDNVEETETETANDNGETTSNKDKVELIGYKSALEKFDTIQILDTISKEDIYFKGNVIESIKLLKEKGIKTTGINLTIGGNYKLPYNIKNIKEIKIGKFLQYYYQDGLQTLGVGVNSILEFKNGEYENFIRYRLNILDNKKQHNVDIYNKYSHKIDGLDKLSLKPNVDLMLSYFGKVKLAENITSNDAVDIKAGLGLLLDYNIQNNLKVYTEPKLNIRYNNKKIYQENIEGNEEKIGKFSANYDIILGVNYSIKKFNIDSSLHLNGRFDLKPIIALKAKVGYNF